MSQYIIDESNFNKIAKKMHNEMETLLVSELTKIGTLFLSPDAQQSDFKNTEKLIQQYLSEKQILQSANNHLNNLKNCCLIFEKGQKLKDGLITNLNGIYLCLDILEKRQEIEHIKKDIHIIFNSIPENTFNDVESKQIEDLKKRRQIYASSELNLNEQEIVFWIPVFEKIKALCSCFENFINNFEEHLKPKSHEKNIFLIGQYIEQNNILKLSSIQNSLANSFGFRNLHGLQKYFQSQIDYKKYKNLELFLSNANADEIYDFMKMFLPSEDNLFKNRALGLLETLTHFLVYLRDSSEISKDNLDIEIFKQYIQYDELVKISHRRDLNKKISNNLKEYFNSIPGYKRNSIEYSDTSKEQHGYIAMNLYHVFNQCEKLYDNYIICPFVGEETEFGQFANKNSHLWFEQGNDISIKNFYINYGTYCLLKTNFGARDYTLFDLSLLCTKTWGLHKQAYLVLLQEFIKNIPFIKAQQSQFIKVKVNE